MDLPLRSSPSERPTVANDWEPSPILADDDAIDAIRSLGHRLRAAHYINRLGGLQIDDPADRPIVELALGRPIDRGSAIDILGGECSANALVRTGGAARSDEQLALSFCVLSDGLAMAIQPLTDDGARSTVYSGSDTWLLRDQAWRYGLRGDRAIDLGTGTGLVAAFLTARYSTVLATDVDPVAARTAQLGRELLDERLRSRLHPLVADVTDGLLRSTFDFVCANTPWVPSKTAQGRVYADGGLTGIELPRRFLVDGASLLAPGGVLIALCLQVVHHDGSDPLGDVLDALESDGFSTSIDPTPDGHPMRTATNGIDAVLPTAMHAQHVCAVVRRP